MLNAFKKLSLGLAAVLALGVAGVVPAHAALAPAAPAAEPALTFPHPPTVTPNAKSSTARSSAPTGVRAAKGQPSVPVSRNTTAKSSALLAPGSGYSYAIGEQTFTGSDGVISNVTVAKPKLETAADGTGTHSLAELAVIASIGGKRQIVEVGYTNDPVVNGGSTDPHIFVFNWVDNAPGCYNGCGFVPYTGVNSIATGTNIASAIGTSKKFIVQYFNSQWWVGYDAYWIGYFPLTDWTSVNPALSSFNNTATILYQLFGEVASINSTTPCTDMGGGDQIVNNTVGQPWTKFASVSFINTTTLPTLNFRTAATSWVGSVSPMYDSVGVSTSLRTFYFGGRGWNSTGTAAGTKGSC